MEEYYRNRLGSILVAAGLLSDDDLNQALENQHKTGRRLGDLLLSTGTLEDADIVEARALQLDIPHIHLNQLEVDPDVIRLLPEEFEREFSLVPISCMDGRLTIAMSNPMDVEAIDMVQRITHSKADPLLASEQAISALIDSAHSSRLGDLEAMLEEAVGTSEIEIAATERDDEDGDLSETRRQSEQAPIVKTVNHILKEAAELNASDIHLEPRRQGLEVRYRVDGALRHIRMLPRSIQPAVLSRIKIMAELDIAEKRLPQDGRIAVQMARRCIDIRLSTLPIQHGERIVMRLLDRKQNTLLLDELDFAERDLANIREIIHKPYGIILVTGPTGSGKTTTLYSFLNEVKCPEVNIITVEDPIEYELEGISQSNVNIKAGLTFAAQLRSILRQDPDIILVGEIRDAETAEIAFRASMTGHLVFSTLHCNDSASAFGRLSDMGVEPFLIASSVSGVLAQRLVRTLCPNCVEEYDPTPDERLVFESEGFDLKGSKLRRAPGCNACGKTGYRGRTLIAEILPVSNEIRHLALDKAAADTIRDAAVRQGMHLMRQDGLNKVLSGLTSFEEVRKRVFLSEE